MLHTPPECQVRRVVLGKSIIDLPMELSMHDTVRSLSPENSYSSVHVNAIFHRSPFNLKACGFKLMVDMYVGNGIREGMKAERVENTQATLYQESESIISGNAR